MKMQRPYHELELVVSITVAMFAAFITGLLLGSTWGASTIRGILAAAG